MRWRRRVCAFGGGCVSKAKSGEGRRSFFFFFWGVNLIHLKIVPLVIQGKPSSLSAELSNEAVTKQEVCDACRWNPQMLIEGMFHMCSGCMVLNRDAWSWNETRPTRLWEHQLVSCAITWDGQSEREREKEEGARASVRSPLLLGARGKTDHMDSKVPFFNGASIWARADSPGDRRIHQRRARERGITSPVPSICRNWAEAPAVGPCVCVCVCAGVRRAKAALGYFWHRGAASCTLKG